MLRSVLVVLCVLPWLCNGQGIDGVKNNSWITYLQRNINHSSYAIGINSIFMKSGIGVDWGLMNSLPKGHSKLNNEIALPDSFFVFDGVAYNEYINYESNLYNPNLMTLIDIKNEYVKDFPLRYCLFMINNIPITTDPRAFKVDREFIVSVRGFAPTEIETLKIGQHFESTVFVIRIYTKEHKVRKGEAVQKYKMKLINDEFRFLIE